MGRPGASIAAMERRPPLLAGLRRSLLGAWLACAYGLTVLAGALAPATAGAHPGLDGAILCSGLAPPGQDAPAPGGEPNHCKGCPVNPVLAAPVEAGSSVMSREALALAVAAWSAADQPRGPRPGLPQSRGPPRV
jgi:hypothetical protein